MSALIRKATLAGSPQFSVHTQIFPRTRSLLAQQANPHPRGRYSSAPSVCVLLRHPSHGRYKDALAVAPSRVDSLPTAATHPLPSPRHATALPPLPCDPRWRSLPRGSAVGRTAPSPHLHWICCRVGSLPSPGSAASVALSFSIVIVIVCSKGFEGLGLGACAGEDCKIEGQQK